MRMEEEEDEDEDEEEEDGGSGHVCKDKSEKNEGRCAHAMHPVSGSPRFVVCGCGLVHSETCDLGMHLIHRHHWSILFAFLSSRQAIADCSAMG